MPVQIPRGAAAGGVAQEVEDTDEDAIYERATWDRLPLKSWSAAGGRVVLLGDAAHAMYSGRESWRRTSVNVCVCVCEHCLRVRVSHPCSPEHDMQVRLLPAR